MTNALGQDGFSLNRAAAALDGLVADTLRFSEFESKTADLPDWADETRTAIALELAAAKLLAHCAAPVMPRFAAKLAAALGLDEPTQWPELVTLVPPGTKINLAGPGVLPGPRAEAGPRVIYCRGSPASWKRPWRARATANWIRRRRWSRSG